MNRLLTILSLMSCILLYSPDAAIAQNRNGTSQAQQDAARKAEAERKAREAAAQREREAAAQRAREEEARRQREREEQARRDRERQEAEARAQREREEQERRQREREEEARRDRERQEAAARAERERAAEAQRQREREEEARRDRERQEAADRAAREREAEARRERDRQEAADRAEREREEEASREREVERQRESDAQEAEERAERERQEAVARDRKETSRPSNSTPSQLKPNGGNSVSTSPTEQKPEKETTTQTKPTIITNSGSSLTTKPHNESTASAVNGYSTHRPTDGRGTDWVLQEWTPAKIPPYDPRPNRPAVVTDYQLQTANGNTNPGSGNTGGNNGSGSGSGSGNDGISGGYYGGSYYDDDFFYTPPVCPPNTYAVPIYDVIAICPIDQSYYFYSPPYALLDCIERGLQELAFMEQHSSWSSITFLCEFKRSLDRVRNAINCLPVWWDVDYYLHDWNYFNDVYHYYNYGGNPEGFVSKDRALFLEYESYYDVKARLLPNLIMELPNDSILNEQTNNYDFYFDTARHIYMIDTTFGDYWGGLEYYDLVVAFNPEDVRAGLNEGKQFDYMLTKTKGYRAINATLDTFSQSYFVSLLHDKVIRDHSIIDEVIKNDKDYATYIAANMHYLIKAVLMVDPLNKSFKLLQQQNETYLSELNWTEQQVIPE